jgi:L-asparaginase II
MRELFAPAAEVLRGNQVESVHFAAAAVVDQDGQLIAYLGSADLVTYSRSSLKPFQALPTVMRGFPDRFGLAEHHLALICASHSGEERHVRAAREILAAIDAKEDHLQCGVHIPLFHRDNEDPIPARKSFSPIFNNCSGKHSGMLALSRILGLPFEGYTDVQSPLQRLIRAQVALTLGVEPGDMIHGIDGCSIPNYAVPLRVLAYGYARLAASVGPKPRTDDECHDACKRIAGAMRTHPEMVSGEGRFDLALAQATKGRVFSKAGGEAVECLGIPERGWGIAVKIADGAARAIAPVVVGVLRQLELLNPDECAALVSLSEPVLRNHRGIEIGKIRMVGELKKTR